MDVSGIAQTATSIAETNSKQAVSLAVMKKAMTTEAASAAALLNALPPVDSIQNLPSHLGNTIDTTA